MRALLAVLTFVAIVPALYSQVTLAGWNFASDYTTGLTGDLTADATTLDANVTGGVLGAQNLTLAYQGIGSDIFGWTNWNTTNSIDKNEFISFSITPNPGTFISLTSLDMYWVRAPGGSGGPRRYQIEVGFTNTGSFVATAISKQATIGNSATDGLLSFDLSGETSVQNISTEVEFRIYGWRSGGDYGGMGDQLGDDLILQGQVVPEPSTYALMVGLLALLGAVLKKRMYRSEEGRV